MTKWPTYVLHVSYRSVGISGREVWVEHGIYTNNVRTEQETLEAARKMKAKLQRYHNNVIIARNGKEVL